MPNSPDESPIPPAVSAKQLPVALEFDAETAVLIAHDTAELLRLQTRLQADLELLGRAAEAANRAARQAIFTTHLADKAKNTQRMYKAALENFTAFLETMDVHLTLRLSEEPRLWEKISFGLVEGFKKWLLLEGYSIKTVNDYVGVIKTYATLAQQAGLITADALVAIQRVSRLAGKSAEHVDQDRRANQQPTRRGHKKAAAVYFEEEHQALLDRLFAQPDDSPQGLRDLVALRLLFDLGIRPGEAIAIHLSDLDLPRRRVRVHRYKTGDERQYLELPPALYTALIRYLEYRRDWARYRAKPIEKHDAPLLVQSRRNKQLFEEHDLEEARAAEVRDQERARRGEPRRTRERKRALAASSDWSTQHLWDRVHRLSLVAGLPPLASYDARHQWTYDAVMGETPHPVLLKAGGWKAGSRMVERYYGVHEVANKGVKLKRDQSRNGPLL
jgi:integrase